MIREITTRESLAAVIEAGDGYLYNDFGGRDPRMCPVHRVRCPWVARMLAVHPGRLGIRKVWSDSYDELTGWLAAKGKPWSACGSETGLAGKHPGTAVRTPAIAVPTPRTRGLAEAYDGADFKIAGDSRSVLASCNHRLQFDSKPETLVLRDAIRAAVGKLAATEGEMLEAVFASDSTETVDAENPLLYNVGCGSFARLTHAGLRFERRFVRHSRDVPHHHSYTIVSVGSESGHWLAAGTSIEFREVVIPRLDEMSRPDGVWLAARTALPAKAGKCEGNFGADLLLRVPTNAVPNSAAIVKPLVDGLVSSLHVHDGRDLPVITARLAARLGLPEGEVRHRLMASDRAWLGERRLLWPRGEGLQWNPGDDRCVTCTLRMVREQRTDWRFDARFFEVAERPSR